LKQEDSFLLSQKEQLVSIGEQLRLKMLEEIEKTKQRISELKTEIPELKQKCEIFAKTLEIPVYNTSD
jgi:DNA-binding HxlR family transcriptional regulator